MKELNSELIVIIWEVKDGRVVPRKRGSRDEIRIEIWIDIQINLLIAALNPPFWYWWTIRWQSRRLRLSRPFARSRKWWYTRAWAGRADLLHIALSCIIRIHGWYKGERWYSLMYWWGLCCHPCSALHSLRAAEGLLISMQMHAGWYPRKVWKFDRYEDSEPSIGQCYTQRCSTFCTLFFSCNLSLSLIASISFLCFSRTCR